MYGYYNTLFYKSKALSPAVSRIILHNFVEFCKKIKKLFREGTANPPHRRQRESPGKEECFAGTENRHPRSSFPYGKRIDVELSPAAQDDRMIARGQLIREIRKPDAFLSL